MNISANSMNVAFGKTPIMSCKVKRQEGNKPVDATLYRLDSGSLADYDDVCRSKTAKVLLPHYAQSTQRNKNNDFYLLQDDQTQEVICAAETSHHFRTTKDRFEGTSTVIDEFKTNKNYANAAEPVIAHIVNKAGQQFDKSVVSALHEEEMPTLKHAKFSKTKNGDYLMPEKRFDNFADRAEKKFSIEYFV